MGNTEDVFDNTVECMNRYAARQSEADYRKLGHGDAPRGSREFETGAVRSGDADRERWDLISPIGLRRVAETCAEGATKYGDFNWEKGMPVHDLLNHAIRHIYLYLSGDKSEPHLPHAAWGLLAAIHSEELWPHLNKGRLREPGCKPPFVEDPRKTVT